MRNAPMPNQEAGCFSGSMNISPKDVAPSTLPAAPIHLLWHARVQQDEGNRWLRGVVIDLFADSAKNAGQTDLR